MNYEIIRAAMQEEIDNPQTFYMPCSPGEFIRDRLFKQSYWEEAVWFWSHYCAKQFGVAELDSLIPELANLTAKDKMPEWGTRGT
jgi:hypothetical protein